MPTLKLSVPNHLSIFVTDPDTGRPIQRLPLYAEIALPRIVPVPPINERFREPMRSSLFDVDSAATDPAVRDRVETAALQALAETVDQASRDRLVSRLQSVKELFHRAFREVLDTANQERMADITPAELKPRIVAALRRVGPELGIGLTPDVEDVGTIWADPLGVLTTDHVGYVSFDLKRLRPDVQVMLAEAIEARRNDPSAASKLAIWIYPYGGPGRFDALVQARFAYDAVVARLSMKWNTLPPALINMGPRALQNPSLTDWRLSPASFAASPKTLVGEDGCEELVPANLALQEFVLRQVVRLSDVPLNFGVPPGFKAAYVDDYKVSWFSLGHSLGEILYSLPLAPGETVKLAVIDWSWDGLTKRDETTKLTEEVLHQTHRDRTITETVKAGLKEFQHGSSFMAGGAHSSGGSGSANLGVVGVGAAVGTTGSIGGSTATSDGSRDLAAENVQRLNDSFSQASSAQREINSTVVIQARQEEKESIQTRTFSNYNHSHTLTILYYQVLRHYRVTVEWVRRRPAVLLQIPQRVLAFDEKTLLDRRHILEPALLDPTLKPGFDAIGKLATIRSDRKTYGLSETADVTHWFDGDLLFDFFEFGAKTSTLEDDDMTNEPENSLRIWALVAGGGLIPLGRWGDFDPEFNVGGRFRNRGEMTWFLAYPKEVPATKIKWADLLGFMIDTRTDTWRVEKLAINGFAGRRKVVLRELKDYNLLFGKYRSSDDDDLGDNTFTEINPPAPAAVPLLSPEKSLTADERHQLNKLKDHCELYKDYYASVIQLNADPTLISIELEGVNWTAGRAADYVDPTPLEVFGSYVAYPLAKQLTAVDDTVVVDIAAALNGNDPARRQLALDRLAAMSEADRQIVLERLPLASAKSERLNTMSTRGVFAEGKLGHCNISEEIDNTRFWKWEEHPIPIEAPDINPVTPIQPQPQQVSATPTAFPQSLVNIVNPSPAPDPGGLAAALSLLGTPNIFRDMSGKQEVADLLKKLSDNSIAIADAANRARDIQTKYGSNLQGIGGSGAGMSGGGNTGAGSARPASGSVSTPGELQDARKELQAAQRDNLITQTESQDLYKGAARLAFGIDAGVVDAGAGDAAVGAAALNAGTFQGFVDAGQLDLEIADLLRELVGYPADSWARQIAAFTHHELLNRNLLGIFSTANAAKVKALLPAAQHADADAMLALMMAGNDDGRSQVALGGPNAYKGYALIADRVVRDGANPGPGRQRLAHVLTHELTHFRNRDFFNTFNTQPVSANPTLYVDVAKANAHANTPHRVSYVIGEIICNHVSWRVQQDLQHRATGAAIPANPNKKGFFRYALALDGAGWPDNGYLADLKAAGTYNRQIAEWLSRIGGEKALFHDDAIKNAAVRQFFKDTHDEAKPQFLKPAEAEEGGL